MTFYATTTVSVLRGTAVDEYGDELDTDTVAASGIRASIIERSVRDIDPSSGDARTLRRVTGRVASDVDIRDGDRIRDDRTGVVYAVGTRTSPAAFSNVSSMQLDLDRTT
jgi:hypothetical protein